MARRSLPPPPDAIPIPATREGPEWDAFCEANPLHMAVCGRASQAITVARVGQIIEWFHKGAAYVTVVGRGRAQWGLQKARMEELIALADEELKRHFQSERHEYVSRMLTKVDGAIEAAIEDRQFSAAAGLIGIVGRWLSLDQSTTTRRL
ncbi:hypothetical protein KBZ07_13995 [Cyanobium sp. BA20m-14]|uniref:hypothetical protein n=1 Tax=Cyanobium sp. BA20m-14 TaxID=2823703 RepID=UPI0020CD2B13|nr:hypothetical protein [Cyanobium sp. BA20m-14]MCP9914488.1 hypothetical protein [Cyanobium sp. BA20m-14]